MEEKKLSDLLTQYVELWVELAEDLYGVTDSSSDNPNRRKGMCAGEARVKKNEVRFNAARRGVREITFRWGKQLQFLLTCPRPLWLFFVKASQQLHHNRTCSIDRSVSGLHSHEAPRRGPMVPPFRAPVSVHVLLANSHPRKQQQIGPIVAFLPAVTGLLAGVPCDRRRANDSLDIGLFS